MSNTIPTASINWQQCIELANQNSEMAKDLLDMFVSDLPEVSSTIHSLYSDKDFKGLQAQVHRLHGATCYCGVPHLRQAAKQLESALKTNKHNTNNELEDLVDILLDEIKAIQTAYQQQNFQTASSE